MSNQGAVESRADITLKADGLRPAVQIAREHLELKCLLTYRRMLISTSRCSQGKACTLRARLQSRHEANALMSLDTGFGAGAYTTTYLNKTGAAAYLDTSVEFGVSGKASLKNVPKVSADTGLRTTASVTEPAQITSKKVSASGTGTLVAANALNFSTKYYDPSSASADSDGNVKETIALGALTHSSSDPLSAADMATYFNEEFKKLSLSMCGPQRIMKSEWKILIQPSAAC